MFLETCFKIKVLLQIALEIIDSSGNTFIYIYRKLVRLLKELKWFNLNPRLKTQILTSDTSVVFPGHQKQFYYQYNRVHAKLFDFLDFDDDKSDISEDQCKTCALSGGR